MNDSEYEVHIHNLNKLAFEHRCAAIGDEAHLYDLAMEYEEQYFEDMRMQPGSIISPYIEHKVQEKGEWITQYESPPVRLESFILGASRFTVCDEMPEGLECAEGAIDTSERIIIIPRKNVENKSVVLHEMIHLYEQMLFDEAPSYRDILITCLYRELSKKVPDIDNRLVAHAQIYISFQTTLMGGEHGILFYLKSLDLDLRCGYPLGTVCGYGRDEFKADE